LLVLLTLLPIHLLLLLWRRLSLLRVLLLLSLLPSALLLLLRGPGLLLWLLLLLLRGPGLLLRLLLLLLLLRGPGLLLRLLLLLFGPSVLILFFLFLLSRVSRRSDSEKQKQC
jgi:hypothetical protein